jgi:hypothetical protein
MSDREAPERVHAARGWPVLFVDVFVVVPTSEFEVGERGGAADGPVHDVVNLAGPWRGGAARVLAVFVAGDDGSGHASGDGAGGASGVEDFAGAIGDDAGDPGVAGEPAGRVAGDDGAGAELGRSTGAGLECLQRCDGHDVGAAGAGLLGLVDVVEEVLADRYEPHGAAL